MRARGFAIRDSFPDALKGISIAEEAQDIVEKDITPARAAPEPITLSYDDEKFKANFPKWEAAIKGGRLTKADAITRASTVGLLTDAQNQQINNIDEGSTDENS